MSMSDSIEMSFNLSVNDSLFYFSLFAYFVIFWILSCDQNASLLIYFLYSPYLNQNFIIEPDPSLRSMIPILSSCFGFLMAVPNLNKSFGTSCFAVFNT